LAHELEPIDQLERYAPVLRGVPEIREVVPGAGDTLLAELKHEESQPLGYASTRLQIPRFRRIEGLFAAKLTEAL
jgi:hypothetical protein